MYFFNLLVAAAVSVAAVGAACPGADKCVDQAAFNQLSKSNAKEYCVKGPRLVAKATACLKECNSDSDYLTKAKAEINAFCKNSDPKCTNVCDEHINQTKCFDPYNGLGSVTSGILETFKKTETRNDTACMQLSWGRYCQKTTNCAYNSQLDLELVKDNPDVVTCMSVCGSESTPELAAQVEDNSKCTDDMDARVASEGDIACELASAQSADAICTALVQQAGNLERITAGCDGKYKKYLGARMSTYLLANVHLMCKITLKGIPVLPVKTKQKNAAGEDVLVTMCNYTTVLNTCFYARAYYTSMNWNRLQPLMNGDMPLGEFCKNLAKKDSELSLCDQVFSPCVPPQYRALSQSTTKDDYVSKFGPFALNPTGMAAVFDYAIKGCSAGEIWTKLLCNPELLVVVTDKTTGRPTQQPRTTYANKKPDVERNIENDIDNYKESVVKDEGSKIAVSLALFGFSMLMTLFTTM